MRLIHRYICRRILVLFPAILLVLTGIIWSTQALQRLDLVTAKGQAVAVFFEVTALAVPFLATMLAPIAFVIAMIAVYDAMNRDSELVVIGASGSGRLTLLAPALISAAVCAAIVAVGAVYLAPKGLAKARVLLADIRADVVADIVQPGRFIDVEDGLTVHIRDRLSDGTLDGLLLDDRRDPKMANTYLAATGRVVEAEGNTLLVMQNGTIQRMERPANELTIIAFDAYAFDLTALESGSGNPNLRPSERTLLELLHDDPDDKYRQQRAESFFVELHDRISQPLAPFVYALVVFVFVGDPRMHRQSRLAGIAAAGISVAVVKGLTYGLLLMAGNAPQLAFTVYLLLAAMAALALFIILTDRSITVHERFASNLLALLNRLASVQATTRAAQ